MASITKRPDGRWRARYRDAEGKEHAKHFDRKVDAQRWLDEVTAAMVTGRYVDPRAARMTFREYAESWRLAQVHRPSSAAHVETMLRLHAYPAFGNRQLGSIRPGEVQAWVKRLSAGSNDHRGLAPATVAVAHGLVAAIFKVAVRDRRLPASPCDGIKLPKQEPRQVVPLATSAVRSLAEAVPPRYSGLITVAAGTGLRQGEAFGLTLDRVDFLRRTLTVDRQLILLAGQLAPSRSPQDAGLLPGPATSSGGCGSPGGAPAAVPRAGQWADLQHGRRHRPQPDPVLRLSLEAGSKAGRAGRRGLPRPASLLRLAPHPRRGVREGRTGPSGARHSRRDAGHLLPPLARLG